MNLKRNKKGFTLIEILIVIAIVGMLSTLAISGYMSYRKTALLDFAADSLISQITEMQENAAHGDFGSEKYESIRSSLDPDYQGTVDDVSGSNSKCFGIYFKSDSGGFSVESYDSDFVGQKVWNNGWEYTGCGADKSNLRNLEVDEMVKIVGISFLNDSFSDISSPSSDLAFQFYPPDGAFEMSIDGQYFEKDFSMSPINYAQIKLQYGDQEDPDYVRYIDFDLVSQKFTIKLNE